MRRAGFTLLEVTTALALAVLVYALVSYTTLQLNRTARAATRAAEARTEVVDAVELLRWQLRCLYVPASQRRNPTQGGRPSPAPSPSPPASRPAGLYLPVSVYGKRTRTEDREILLFRTTRLKRTAGATEVGYRIMEDEDGGEPYLAYREFPFADEAGLHTEDESEEAPWKVLTRQVVGMRLEFSPDGETWQREWEALDVPVRVRVTLVTLRGDTLVAESGPGIVAPRW